MSAWLIRMTPALPGDMDPEIRADLRDRTRAALADWSGARLWRSAGTGGLIALVDAPDADAVHGLIAALPAHRWLVIHVEPLSEWRG